MSFISAKTITSNVKLWININKLLDRRSRYDCGTNMIAAIFLSGAISLCAIVIL